MFNVNSASTTLCGLTKLALGSVSIAALISCGGGSSAPPPTATAPSMDARSKISYGPCPVTLESQAVCGTLTVAQDRADPASRLIGLPFAILPSISPNPEKDPIAIYVGGPGESALDQFAAIPAEALRANPLRANRDLIGLTHRGISRTVGGDLTCTETIVGPAGFATTSAIQAAFMQCRSRLLASGIDLKFYNTKIIARDWEDLRLLLGKERGFVSWNIVGASYGSLLAQQSVRDTPLNGIRSIVFDGTLPYGLPTSEESALDAASDVLDACADNSPCKQAFPDLRNRFEFAIAALDTAPVAVGERTARASAAITGLGAILTDIQSRYGEIPFYMDLIAKGEYLRANEIYNLLDTPRLLVDPQSMFYAVNCTDSEPRSVLLERNSVWSFGLRRIQLSSNLAPVICPAFIGQDGVDGARANRLPQITVDIPSLITVGQFDPATSVRESGELLPFLRKGQRVVFTGRGHILLFDACGQRTMAAFFDNPTQPVSTACVDPANSLTFRLPDAQ